jgi:WD40 repeat protein
MRLRNHGLVLWLAVSPDSSKVASMDFIPGTRVRVWDRATGRLRRDWDHGEMSGSALCFTPDGKSLLTCHGHVWLWDLATGTRKPWAPGVDDVVDAFFNKDGRTLALRCSDNRGKAEPCLRLYDFPSGKKKATITTEDQSACQVACFTPTGQVVFATYKALRLWDVKAEREVARVKLAGTPRALAVSPDGKTFAVHWYRGAVTLVRPGATLQVAATAVKGDTPSALIFSPDGKEVWFAPPTGPVVAIDPKTGKQTRQVIPYDGRPSAGRFSARGDYLVRFVENQVITVHDTRTGKETPVFDDHRDGSPVEAVPSPDGNRVATRSAGAVRLWELRTGKLLRHIPGKGFVPGLRWTDKGKSVVVAVGAGKLCWYDASTGRLTRQVDLPTGKVVAACVLPGAKRGRCTVEDNKYRRRLIVFDLAAPRGRHLHATEPVEELPALSPELSPDGKRALHLDFEKNTLRIVDVGSDKALWQQPLPASLQARAFSPDGLRVLLWAGGKLLAWRTETGEALGGVAMGPERGRREWLGLSPDGRTAVLGLQGLREFKRPGVQALYPLPGTQVRLVETATGQVRRELPLLPLVSGVSFSRDGRHLITASADGSALVWDLAMYTAAMTPHTWGDLGSPDGRTAFAAVCSLAADPKRALPLLATRVHPARVEARRVRGWIEGLDAESFEKRDEAQRQLGALREHVEADLRHALKNASVEARARLQRLLRRIETGNAEQWRRGRAVEVLERIGTARAVEILKKLAGGYPGSALTREAKDALARLARR